MKLPRFISIAGLVCAMFTICIPHLSFLGIWLGFSTVLRLAYIVIAFIDTHLINVLLCEENNFDTKHGIKGNALAFKNLSFRVLVRRANTTSNKNKLTSIRKLWHLINIWFYGIMSVAATIAALRLIVLDFKTYHVFADLWLINSIFFHQF
ncbi:hypothetical protein MtrunA17_Chr5g0430221 [Medicago truncatula]|uniref:Transmembrane protein n=1 Tax=Medicago truncatula TaxID=3880 RepID=A0A396HVG4_MEDTR|nr:hypothetical protein MtrunA17_Chr5g0430221 [Medicago truncatula]